MPIDWTDLERVGVLIGESVSDDVSAWSEPIELNGEAKMLINRDGVDYEVVIRRVDGRDAA